MAADINQVFRRFAPCHDLNELWLIAVLFAEVRAEAALTFVYLDHFFSYLSGIFR